MTVKSIVRVATNNNFNCTAKEFRQLDQIAAENPDKRFFVNCNARTPKLASLLNHPYKAVITLNPDLKVNVKVADRAIAVSPMVAFYRVKWLPERPEIAKLIERVAAISPVVITMQRFNGRKCLEAHTDAKHYKFECSRFRLHGESLKTLEDYVDAHVKVGLPMGICDRAGLGCQGCGFCATLNGAEGAPIESLNLSTSGICPYNCPDCYAKALQKFLVSCGNAPMAYDKIKRNKKQTGQTKHIKDAQRKAA